MPHQLTKLTPNLVVADVARGVGFYRDVLGFGGTLTLFVEVTGIEAIHRQLADRVNIVMPLETKWYGLTEFAFTDADGYVVTYAERERRTE